MEALRSARESTRLCQRQRLPSPLPVLCHRALVEVCDQVELEVRTVVVVLDPRGPDPPRDATGAGGGHDVTQPGRQVGLEATVLYDERALPAVVGAAGDDLGGDVRASALDAARGHEQGRGVAGDAGEERLLEHDDAGPLVVDPGDRRRLGAVHPEAGVELHDFTAWIWVVRATSRSSTSYRSVCAVTVVRPRLTTLATARTVPDVTGRNICVVDVMVAVDAPSGRPRNVTTAPSESASDISTPPCRMPAAVHSSARCSSVATARSALASSIRTPR